MAGVPQRQTLNLHSGKDFLCSAREARVPWIDGDRYLQRGPGAIEGKLQVRTDRRRPGIGSFRRPEIKKIPGGLGNSFQKGSELCEMDYSAAFVGFPSFRQLRPGRGPEEARTGPEGGARRGHKRPGRARRGPEEARRGQEEARTGPAEARKKRPRPQKTRNPEFDEKRLET